MTYDQWKTTDPRDYEPEQEDEMDELDRAYEALNNARSDARYEAQVAADRIKKLEAALEEALEYFKDNYDVVDGDYGEPRPNKEMALGQMIDETLYGIRF